jgi:hypothetical protein
VFVAAKTVDASVSAELSENEKGVAEVRGSCLDAASDGELRLWVLAQESDQAGDARRGAELETPANGPHSVATCVLEGTS